MSTEGNRQSVLKTTKVRTALKGDSSWIQRSQGENIKNEEEEEEEKPWMAEVRANRTNGIFEETSPATSPTAKEPQPKTNTEIPTAPTSGYLIRGVFRKTDSKPTSTSANGFAGMNNFTKKPSESYKKIAPHTIRTNAEKPVQSEPALSPEELEKRTEAAISVLKDSSTSRRSYVLSAAKKYETTDKSDSSPMTSTSFVAKRVVIGDDDDIAATKPASTVSVQSAPQQSVNTSIENTTVQVAKEVKPVAPQTKSEPKPATEIKPAPETKPAPNLEPKPMAETKTLPVSTTVPEPKPLVEIKTSPVVETKPAPEPKPAAESKPVVEIKTAPVPKPVVEIKTAPVPKPVVETKPAPEPKPAAEPKPVVEIKTAPVPKPVVETKPAPEPKPAAEPKPVVEIKTAPVPKPVVEIKTAPELKPVVETKPAPEPKPTSEPKPAAVSKTTTETKTATETKPRSEPKPVAVTQLKPSPEPTPEKSTESLISLSDTLISFKTEPARADPKLTPEQSNGLKNGDLFNLSKSTVQVSVNPDIDLLSQDLLTDNSSLPQTKQTVKSLDLLADDIIPFNTSAPRISTEYTYSHKTQTVKQQEDFKSSADLFDPIPREPTKSPEWFGPPLDSTNNRSKDPDNHFQKPLNLAPDMPSDVLVSLADDVIPINTDRSKWRTDMESKTYTKTVDSAEQKLPESESKKGCVYVKEYVNNSHIDSSSSDYLTSTTSNYNYSTPSFYSRKETTTPCTYCGEMVGNDAKITIEHLNISCHPSCFKCGICTKPMGDLLYNMFLHRGVVHCESCYANVL
ncbi:proteoglycan 4-like isoform X2 [Xyrauchen texanus]|uniref:proteoglycan 4-like isoform X2 n=1 Tax=Xyrauchen texanus TaxID=154827 RepID=UPI0022427377|nr:proteoglycan 4-like isoform X2 [Xyrauchen texanus]